MKRFISKKLKKREPDTPENQYTPDSIILRTEYEILITMLKDTRNQISNIREFLKSNEDVIKENEILNQENKTLNNQIRQASIKLNRLTADKARTRLNQSGVDNIFSTFTHSQTEIDNELKQNEKALKNIEEQEDIWLKNIYDEKEEMTTHIPNISLTHHEETVERGQKRPMSFADWKRSLTNEQCLMNEKENALRNSISKLQADEKRLRSRQDELESQALIKRKLNESLTRMDNDYQTQLNIHENKNHEEKNKLALLEAAIEYENQNK